MSKFEPLKWDTKEEALEHAGRMMNWLPYNLFWYVTDGKKHGFVCGVTKARGNNYARKGYEVYELKKN